VEVVVHRIIMDCDPGHDDAIALMLAVADPAIELLAVTTVAGNVELEHTTRNALRVLELLGRSDIPVAAGRDQPRARPLSTAAVMHGAGGLAGPLSVPPATAPVAASALELIEQTLMASTDPVTLVVTGPQTNAADVVEQLPHLHNRIARIVFMGGAIGLGNWTPAAEFNIWVDPESAEVVLRSGIPITMVGLDVTHEAWLTDEHADTLRDNGVLGAYVAALLDHFVGFHQRTFGWPGAPIHDAVAVAAVIDPSLLETVHVNVSVEAESALCVGRTVVDRWRVTERQANVDVAIGIDRDRFVTLLMTRLASLRY
jgi:pyrimidine-specific ribonucleoside hydrolase